MTDGVGDSKRSLDMLPLRIADAHRRLRDAIDTLCVLEDFLLGVQVREVAAKPEREVPSGVVDNCFDNLKGICNSIQECHTQLRDIIEKLGAASPEGPAKP